MTKTKTHTEFMDWPTYLRWVGKPSALRGVASVFDIAGSCSVDAERFSPRADRVMLRRDGRLLAIEYKRAYDDVLAELRRQAAGSPQRERLFDPDVA